MRSAGHTAATWEALGTTAVLRVADHHALGQAQEIVERTLREVDLACSRFREDSELSRVNREAGRHVPIGPLLSEALALALRAAELTGGLVDPCIGRALLLAGYDRDWRLLEQPAPGTPRPGGPLRLRAIAREGWRAVELDGHGGTVRIPAGATLDLGATAKAWAADLCAEAATQATGATVLVCLGGDVATAGEAPAGGWRIHVTDDHRAGASAPGQTVVLHSGGLATSSTSVRRWVSNGSQMHHIIDPRTGSPASGRWRTISVAAADCADANIASTAAILMGDAAPEWLAGLSLPARLVSEDGEVVRTGRWPVQIGAPNPARAARPARQLRSAA